MTMTQVTDEMVQRAGLEISVQFWGMPREAAGKLDGEAFEAVKAALESVADDLRAEGMREAAGMMEERPPDGFGYLLNTRDAAYEALLARANQLSPATQKETA